MVQPAKNTVAEGMSSSSSPMWVCAPNILGLMPTPQNPSSPDNLFTPHLLVQSSQHLRTSSTSFIFLSMSPAAFEAWNLGFLIP